MRFDILAGRKKALVLPAETSFSGLVVFLNERAWSRFYTFAAATFQILNNALFIRNNSMRKPRHESFAHEFMVF